MLKLNNPNNIPLDSTYIIDGSPVTTKRWVFLVQQTEVLVEGGHQQDLLMNVMAHYRSNKIPIPVDLPDIIEDSICRHSLSPCHKSKDLVTKEGLLAKASRFGHCVWLMLQAKLKGQSPFIEQDEAERRAGICVECPANLDSPECKGCSDFAGAIIQKLGSLGTSHDEDLKVCSVCGCNNRAAVWVDGDILEQCSDADYKKINPKCWKK
jgi:hypothetical protein